MFGRLIVFFGQYSASRKFLGGLEPAFFFRRIFGLFWLISQLSELESSTFGIAD